MSHQVPQRQDPSAILAGDAPVQTTARMNMSDPHLLVGLRTAEQRFVVCWASMSSYMQTMMPQKTTAISGRSTPTELLYQYKADSRAEEFVTNSI